MKSFSIRVWTGLALLMAAVSARGGTLTVTNTLDAGPGSLRQAILDANAASGTDTIQFGIPGSGVQTIHPSGTMVISDVLVIDGFTQTGASPNTLAVGNNAVYKIEIDGSGLPFTNNLFNLNAPGTIRGLVIHDVPGVSINVNADAGIVIGNFIGTDVTGSLYKGTNFDPVRLIGTGDRLGGTAPADRNVLIGGGAGGGATVNVFTGHNSTIQGNYIAVNAAGTAALAPNPLTTSGISLFATHDNLIGGTAPGAGNVIFGNSAITLGASANNNVIQGNRIGTNATGTARLGGAVGIFTNNAPTGNLIGGSAAGAGNVISGNGDGIVLTDGAAANMIQGNFIGTDPTGALAVPNNGSGIRISTVSAGSLIGGVNPGEGNTIAFNRGAGVYFDFSSSYTGWAIRGNSIHDNVGLGIDHANPGVNPNDALDADDGPNHLQNFPIIHSINIGASAVTVDGILKSTPSTTFDIDFFETPLCQPRSRDFFEAKRFLTTRQVTTDGAGDAPFSFALPFLLDSGSWVTATATDPAGNTSEISQQILLDSTPRSGSSAGGTVLNLSGMYFGSPATVSIGSFSQATNVVVTGPGSMQATVPALPPGVYDVLVDVPGFSGGLVGAYVSDFLDVPSFSPLYPFVVRLVANRVTAGCGSGNFCPSADVTRAQMAVFLLRGFNGACYAPPPAAGTVFTDVPLGSFAAAYIEALAAAQVTTGCGGGFYCPNNPVTRAQMAVFLLRTAEGPTYVPPACVTPTFADVTCNNNFAIWIEELVRRGITAGCGNGNYCPGQHVSRAQMAVFLGTTFGLP